MIRVRQGKPGVTKYVNVWKSADGTYWRSGKSFYTRNESNYDFNRHKNRRAWKKKRGVPHSIPAYRLVVHYKQESKE